MMGFWRSDPWENVFPAFQENTLERVSECASFKKFQLQGSLLDFEAAPYVCVALYILTYNYIQHLQLAKIIG